MSLTGAEDRYMLREHVENIRRASVPSSDPEAQRFIDRFGRNGIEMVRANGKGIPLLSALAFREIKKADGAWLISGSASFPSGLVRSPDRRVQGGVLLCPDRDMAVAQYAALLAQVGLQARYV